MDKRINNDFDRLLQKQKIIQETDVLCVHGWVDEYLKLTSWYDRETGLDISEVKMWVINEGSWAPPEVLTDYLRAALGHLLIASLSAGFQFGNYYELLKRAFQIYQERNYHNCSIEESELLLTA